MPGRLASSERPPCLPISSSRDDNVWAFDGMLCASHGEGADDLAAG